MIQPLADEVLHDEVAVSLARAIAAANAKARAAGVEVAKSRISITQQAIAEESTWRINYGPKDYVGRRGGDLVVEVDARDGTVKRVVRGQQGRASTACRYSEDHRGCSSEPGD